MIPASITNPIIAIALKSFPVISSPKNPPVNAIGIVNKMINGDFSDWNCATMIKYINATASNNIRPICPVVS